jgi:hypothetical protein
MEFLEVIKDSVETSVCIKLFPSLEIASYNHIFYSHFSLFPISNCITLQNFNSMRLSNNPYPEDDRPRGDADLESVLYHQQMIREIGHTEPVWIVLKDNQYILLDGVHRIVATYLENKQHVHSYIIKIS